MSTSLRSCPGFDAVDTDDVQRAQSKELDHLIQSGARRHSFASAYSS